MNEREFFFFIYEISKKRKCPIKIPCEERIEIRVLIEKSNER